jgi:hypothetical protein
MILKHTDRAKYIVLAMVVLLLYPSCTYYARNVSALNQHLNNGNIKEAYKVISHKEKKWDKGKDRVLYYLNRGTIAWMLGKNEESYKYFLKADYYWEDLNVNYSREALSYLINPRVKEYAGEDFEGIMISYYQILNFIQMNDLEKANIQARRLVNQLNRVDDKYKDWQGKNKSTKLQHNAFAHTLLGLVYELNQNYNSAFISYRNAYKYYDEEYSQYFGLNAPLQLKKDLIRTAYLGGFPNDVEYYSKKFNLPFNPATDAQGGNLVFFWGNGLAPIKDQVSADFTIVKGAQNGWYTFSNAGYGYTIPFYMGSNSGSASGNLSDIEFIRAAFPTYVDRKPYYQSATLFANGQKYPFEVLEDVNATAHKTLNDRMLMEFGKTLGRLAIKKLAESQTKKENEELGAVIGIVNYLTEQADTRAWTSLPRTLSYTRVSLPMGKQTVKLSLQGQNNSIDTASFSFNIQPNKIYFQPYQTVQSSF